MSRAAWVGVAACLATLILCALVGFKAWRIGVPGQWTWPFREQAGLWGWAVVPAVVFAGLLACVLWASRASALTRAQEALAAALLFVFGLALFYTVPFVDPTFPYQEEALTAFPWAGGYYTESLFIDDPVAYLRGYPDLITELTVEGPLGHIANHPPGPALFHWALNRLAASSGTLRSAVLPDEGETAELMPFVRQWTAIAFADRPAAEGTVDPPPVITDAQTAGLFMASHAFRFLAALTVVPVYLLGRALEGRRAAVLAGGLAAVIPSMHAFSPFLDQLFCPVAAFCVLFTVWALQRRSVAWAAAAAGVLFVGMQFTLAFLVIAAIGFTLGLFWAVEAKRNDMASFKWAPWLNLFGAALAGFLAPLAALHLLLGYDSVLVWWICYVQHAGFSELFNRTYWPWLLMGPVDFAVFLGAPLAILVGLAAWRNAGEWRRGERPMPVLWSVLAVLAVLAVTGKNRGEVARLWMMAMPLLGVSAARLLTRLDPRPGALTAAVMVSMFVQTVVFRGSLEVLKIG